MLPVFARICIVAGTKKYPALPTVECENVNSQPPLVLNSKHGFVRSLVESRRWPQRQIKRMTSRVISSRGMAFSLSLCTGRIRWHPPPQLQLAALLRDYIANNRKQRFLFETRNGTMIDRGNFWRDGFATVMEEMGREDANFHSFRPFREATLLGSDCRDLLIDYCMRHENGDMASRYGQQLVRNRKYRAEQAAKAGLGFDIPITSVPQTQPFAIREAMHSS